MWTVLAFICVLFFLLVAARPTRGYRRCPRS